LSTLFPTEVSEEVKKPPLFTPLRKLGQKRKPKIGVWGDTETGKSHFILTCPEPIYVIDTEFGISPLAHKFKDKEIYVMETFIEDPETMKADPLKSLSRVEEAVDSLRDVEEGTIAIDSGTDLWQWCEAYMKAEVGEIGRKMLQWDWQIANKRYKNLMLKLLSRNTVFVITAQPQELYLGPGQRTGIYVPRWQKQTPFWMDVVLHMEKKPLISPEPKVKSSSQFDRLKYIQQPRRAKYIATVEKCRFERQFNKQVEDMTYDKLEAILKELGVM